MSKRDDLLTNLKELRICEMIPSSVVTALAKEGGPVSKMVDKISLCLLDNGKPTAIYPPSQRNKFITCTRLAGYSERMVTPEDITNNPHCVYRKKARRSKVEETGELGFMDSFIAVPRRF